MWFLCQPVPRLLKAGLVALQFLVPLPSSEGACSANVFYNENWAPVGTHSMCNLFRDFGSVPRINPDGLKGWLARHLGVGCV